MSFFRSHPALIVFAGLIFLILQAGTSAAQTATWIAPGSGYVYDSVNRDIRPISGYLGSATLGPSLVDGINWASIAPNQKSAILQRGAAMVWIPDLGTPDQAQNLDLAFPQQLFWASDSSHAVMLAGSRLIWLTNSGSSPSLGVTWSLGTSVRRSRIEDRPRWSLLAADSSADKVLLSAQIGGQGQLWEASQSTPPTPIPFPGQPAAAVFASGNSTVLIADTLGNQIVQTSSLGAVSAWTPLLNSAEYVKDPAGLALSTDNSRLFIADRTTNIIRVFDSRTGRLITELPADVVPQSLAAFTSGLFLLGSTPPGPFEFLNTSASPGVEFVPRGE